MPQKREAPLVEMNTLTLTAYALVIDPVDPAGPIDAVVPWAHAPLFIEAITEFTGEKPNVKYVRPNLGRITGRGRRAVLESRL